MQHLLEITHAQLRDLLTQIESQDGEIDEAQESQLKNLLATEREAIAETAKAVYEAEAEAEMRRETRKRWSELAGEQIHRLEARAARLRRLITAAMGRVTEAKERTLRSEDRAVAVTYCDPRKSGKLEIALEPVVVTGYDLDVVMTSDLPSDLFEQRTMFTLNKDALREWLKDNPCRDARIVYEPSIRIKIAG